MKILIQTDDAAFETTMDDQCAIDDGFADMRDEIEATMARGETFCDGGAGAGFTVTAPDQERDRP